MKKQKEVRGTFDLVDQQLISQEHASELEPVVERYSLAITSQVLSLIEKSGFAGPIGRQFIPSTDELKDRPEENADPIADSLHSPVPGIVHRHADRVLLKIVHVCPVYCRFCFRKSSVGRNGEVITPDLIEKALEYIRNDPDIWEVILSGGDPFSMSDDKLEYIIRELNTIPHLQVIRIHTRYPIVSPSRITRALLKILRLSKLAVFIVLHCNHVLELTEDVTKACRRLTNAGIPLLSQTVLLSGVNDSVESLEYLMRALVARRIKPYYLHHLDLAKGTNHFRVPIPQGQKIMKLLRGKISGLCQPTYVLEIPGGFGKVPVEDVYIEQLASGSYRVRDHQNKMHLYRECLES